MTNLLFVANICLQSLLRCKFYHQKCKFATSFVKNFIERRECLMYDGCKMMDIYNSILDQLEKEKLISLDEKECARDYLLDFTLELLSKQTNSLKDVA